MAQTCRPRPPVNRKAACILRFAMQAARNHPQSSLHISHKTKHHEKQNLPSIRPRCSCRSPLPTCPAAHRPKRRARTSRIVACRRDCPVCRLSSPAKSKTPRPGVHAQIFLHRRKICGGGLRHFPVQRLSRIRREHRRNEPGRRTTLCCPVQMPLAAEPFVAGRTPVPGCAPTAARCFPNSITVQKAACTSKKDTPCPP